MVPCLLLAAAGQGCARTSARTVHPALLEPFVLVLAILVRECWSSITFFHSTTYLAASYVSPGLATIKTLACRHWEEPLKQGFALLSDASLAPQESPARKQGLLLPGLATIKNLASRHGKEPLKQGLALRKGASLALQEPPAKKAKVEFSIKPTVSLHIFQPEEVVRPKPLQSSGPARGSCPAQASGCMRIGIGTRRRIRIHIRRRIRVHIRNHIRIRVCANRRSRRS